METQRNNFDDMLNVSAVPQADRKEAFIAESRNNRNRCYELSKKMTEAVAADGEVFQQYLDMQSRFDRYTANNVLLIMAQNPRAEKIGDYNFWRDKGVYVKRQERGNAILIMEPGKEYEREDGSIGTYYNAKKVYDITQTTMKDRIQPQEGSITDEQLVRAVLNNPPVTIIAAEPDQMPEGKGAFFDSEEKCIYVRRGMTAEDIFRSITPELVFAAIADAEKEYDRSENAFCAYCVSYVLCRKYGVDTKGFDFSHAPEVFEGMEPQEVRAELSRVRDAAGEIMLRMERGMESQKQSRQQQNRHEREEAR